MGTVSSKIILLLLATSQRKVLPLNPNSDWSNQSEIEKCKKETNCNSCLRMKCGWAATSQCLPSCSMIADVSCYESSKEENAIEACERAKKDKEDWALCSKEKK